MNGFNVASICEILLSLSGNNKNYVAHIHRKYAYLYINNKDAFIYKQQFYKQRLAQIGKK